MTTRRTVFKALAASGLVGSAAPLSAADSAASRIRQIDLVHHSHNDIGYTDLPSLCRELQVRFLDAALDACVRDAGFRWTAESLAVIDDWWRVASAHRRNQLVAMVRKGQMDAMALPFNQAPFLNARQWKQILAWMPETLWKQLNPRVAMQSDVNGFPRAGMLGLLDRGIKHLIMGINADSGGPPFVAPCAFWWKMPDGRKVFVWQGLHYGVAYRFFEPKNWQPRQAKAASTTYRPAREADFLRKDEASLRKARAHLHTRLEELEKRGYSYDRLILSYTGQWRYDNDAPWPPLSKYVAAWNELGLEPKLRLTTMTDAIFDMQKSLGAIIPTVEGEWTDWWANGDASGPREVAASRFAKRSIEVALSPLWGPLPETANRRIEALLKDLCLFDEHTWGANVSISEPDSLFTQGQYVEKSLTAYKPMGYAEFLVGQRVRSKLEGRAVGLHVANPARAPYTGWATFELDALHGEFNSVVHTRTGTKQSLEVMQQKPWARFWIDRLAPESIEIFVPKPETVTPAVGAIEGPGLELDSSGWPVEAAWPGMRQPLFKGRSGEFLVAAVKDRHTVTSVHAEPDVTKRKSIREAGVSVSSASYEQARRRETPYTVTFEQEFTHSRLGKSRRTVEFWKLQPRARFHIRLRRLPANSPEVFYLDFETAAAGEVPRLSNGGVVFTPYVDQIPGTCRDYFAIDGWAQWKTPVGDWLWVSRDAPLVAIGGPHTLERHNDRPSETNRITAMVFDNCWHTNFVADQSGEMTFQFDLIWREKMDDPAVWAEMLVTDPIIFWNSGAQESLEIMTRVFRP
jgi:hypothetical protein